MRLAPLVQLADVASGLNGRQRSTMVALMRAKGGPTERHFVAAALAQPALMAGLHAYASEWTPK